MPADKPFDDKLSIPELEEKVAEFWEREKIFEASLEKTKDGKPFTFYDGPPFATGLPHYGHILASTIKDVVPRYQTLKGRFVRRRWGWDCHGLPIEEIVERKLGISGKKQIEEIGIQKFNETCRSMVLQYVAEWRKMVRRMGRWIEFDNSYKTMDRDYMESVWWAFKQIYDKSLVYEGRKVLMYCPRCETPISNFEVAMDNSYKDVSEESVYVKFKIKSGDAYFLAWTTTPWTLPGNVALAVGKDIDYIKANVGGETLILAKDLAEKVLPAGYETLETLKGGDLVGLAYEALFEDLPPEIKGSDKAFRVYAADFVTIEEGTGIVHTAVVYGEDDYKLGLEVGLPVVPLLDEKGKFKDIAPELVRGQYFKDSEKAVKDDLEKRGLLFKRAVHAHSYPHCWRCGTPLYYNAIPAWFINIQKIKKDLVLSNDKEVNWFPGHLKHGRYEKSVEAAPDWNISRNRYWGNPIPVWKCKECGENKVAGSIADLKLAPTTFYFVRHGEGEQNVLDVVSGFPELKEYHLTETGRAQAGKVAEELTGKGIDLVLSSDILRAKETAEAISKALGIPVALEPRLREINTGVWNGKPGKEYRKAVPKDGWWNEAAEGGETYGVLQARMMEVVNELTAKHPGKRIVLVSHGDPIFYTLLRFNQPLAGQPAFATPYEITTGLTDLHRPYIDEVVLQCEKCGGEARRITEIFDSWVEAGSMPFSEYHYPFENKELFESRFPAQFVAEYIAQTRAWFYVMHVISQVLFGRAPFENVVTTGTILAEDGSKMSKSKNNFPDPWVVINKYGVDTLRFYLMNSVVMQADNLNFSLKDLENIHRKVTMLLWNVYQYYQTYSSAALTSSVPDQGSGKNVLDLWIKARTKELVIEVTEYLDAYDTVKATRMIEEYISDLSTWYLRRSRGRDDAGFYPAFRETLTAVSKVLAPFMPHIAEAIHMNLTGVSVHLSDWPAKEALTEEEQKLLKQMQTVREAASLALAARKAENIPVRQPLASATIELAAGNLKLDAALEAILRDEINIKEIVFAAMSGEAPVAKLNTVLTPELKLEGLTRQLERFVQGMRKDQGFKVGEMATLNYETADPDIEKALSAIDTKKTYLSSVQKGAAQAGADFEGKAKIAIART